MDVSRKGLSIWFSDDGKDSWNHDVCKGYRQLRNWRVEESQIVLVFLNF